MNPGALKRVLILDTETTGLDHKKDSVIEVAAILYSIQHATVLQCFSSLIYANGNAAEAINRIPPAALLEAPLPPVVWRTVRVLAQDAEVIVAHNAEFDRSFSQHLIEVPLTWVCSKDDIQWPKQTKTNPSLVPLALEHDLGVAYAHRALADCDLIARLFTRSRELGADLNAMLTRAMRPKALFVSLAPFEEKDVVKAHGFQWFPEIKQWRRQMAIEDVGALPFKTRQVAA